MTRIAQQSSASQLQRAAQIRAKQEARASQVISVLAPLFCSDQFESRLGLGFSLIRLQGATDPQEKQFELAELSKLEDKLHELRMRSILKSQD